ncbi:hypothetical protein GUJ93_ZPchr0010g10645 [Zizania palustris]|uniref:Uncharacterized protein n=1 Tax=Zizania palustris TaxID=103762 RepID=A0A8J5WAU1_ZIZPA|nr:hypothetical protein GUJ93_ZPchr0010g10645 [Zizania palustris]
MRRRWTSPLTLSRRPHRRGLPHPISLFFTRPPTQPEPTLPSPPRLQPFFRPQLVGPTLCGRLVATSTNGKHRTPTGYHV